MRKTEGKRAHRTLGKLNCIQGSNIEIILKNGMGKCGLALSESGHGPVPDSYTVSLLKCLGDIGFFKVLEFFSSYQYKILPHTIAF